MCTRFDLAREIRAIPRGFGYRAQTNPNRRLRVRGLECAVARVFLCCQVGRFGFAFHSPRSTESSSSTCSATQSAVAKTLHPHLARARMIAAVSRGLAEATFRIRTRDRKFEIGREQLGAFVSVAELGGPDSLGIRPQRRSSVEQCYVTLPAHSLDLNAYAGDSFSRSDYPAGRAPSSEGR